MADQAVWFSLVLPAAEYQRWEERQNIKLMWLMLGSLAVLSLAVLASVKLFRTLQAQRPRTDRAKHDGTFDSYEL
jgi:hypothetical protein